MNHAMREQVNRISKCMARVAPEGLVPDGGCCFGYHENLISFRVLDRDGREVFWSVGSAVENIAGMTDEAIEAWLRSTMYKFAPRPSDLHIAN
jgi:hypothetical protein